jgi:uncharacterized membrane protein YdjX (TVP38/TMEM64 family)
MTLLSERSAEVIYRLSTAMEAAGPWTGVVLSACLILGAFVLAPRPLLCFLVGLSCGPWGGPLALICAATGAALVFQFSRRCLRSRLGGELVRHQLVTVVLKAVGQEGFRAVLLLRLAPVVPSSMQSYLFALTDIGFRPYMIATVLGIFPGVTLQVWAGHLSRAALQHTLGVWDFALSALSLVALCSAIWFIGRRARQLRHEHLVDRI